MAKRKKRASKGLRDTESHREGPRTGPGKSEVVFETGRGHELGAVSESTRNADSRNDQDPAKVSGVSGHAGFDVYVNCAALERGTLPAFFYLDLEDTRRRAMLLTTVVRDRIPTVASLKCDYARALAQIGNTRLKTTGEPRVVSDGPILRVATARKLREYLVANARFPRRIGEKSCVQ